MTTDIMSGDPGSLTEEGSARTFSSLLEQNAEAGPSRSSIDDVRRRPHSMSMSSVHFVDMPHRKSDASLRHQALRASESMSAAAAASESSGRSPRSSQPMRHASSFSHPSPTMPSPRGLVRSPVSQQAMSPPGASNTTEGSPKGSGRRSSQERRVRSEGGRPLRQNSLIANGIRPSAVTGGYESSSDDDTPDVDGRPPPVQAVEPVKPTRTTYEFPRFQPSQSFSGARGLNGLGIADFTRKRSLSLMTPLEGGSLSPTSRSGSDASGTKSRNRSRAGSIGLLPLRPDGGSRRGSRDVLRPSGLRASPLSASGPSFPTFPSSRLPSSRSAQIPAERGDLFSSPGHHGHRKLPEEGDAQHDAPSPYSTDADRKGKGRDKASAPRNGLVASLGLATSRNANAALTSDQINELLTDSDVASALRLMSGNSAGSAALPTPRRADVVTDQGLSSRPFTPTNLQEPFIATAPPPVTTQSPEARATSRERKISVHSAADSHDPSSTQTSSPGRRSELDERLLRARKRRASSRITLGGEPEGGHIPFTHHVTQPIESKSAVLEDSDEDTVPPPKQKESDPRPESSLAQAPGLSKSPAPSRGTVSPKPNGGMPGKKIQSRGRLSAILGLKRRKSDASGDSKSGQSIHTKPYGDAHRPNGNADKTEAQKIAERQKEKEEREREEEMRLKEQERRESELAQERRYKALTQVAAHPRSERLAYQAGSHLQAFYNHIYDGLDNPPRMNPLAVLRWKHRTEEQNQLRQQWEEKVSREIAERVVVQDKGRSPRSGFSERFSDSSRSLQMDSQRPAKSNGLGIQRRSSTSRPNGGRRGAIETPALWWRYSIEDVSAYKECKGVVDYFIPSRETIPEQSRASEDDTNDKARLSGENASSPAARPAASGDKASKKGGSEVWVESQDVSVRKSHDIHSSIDGSLADDHGGALRRMDSNTGSFAPLSRTTSVETSARAEHAAMRKHSHHVHHRHHHSLGGQAALAYVIKAPFEKLSSVARRQRTMPYLDGDPSDSGHEIATPSRRETIGLHPSQSVLRRAAAAHSNFSPASGVAAATIAASGGIAAQAAIGGDRAGNLTGSVRSRATDRLFRRSIGHEGSGRASLTDEDTRPTSTSRGQQARNGGPGHLPKLFLKGDRLTTKLQAIGSVPLDLIRGGIGHRLAGHDPVSPEYRQAELAVLEEELRRETAFRERMVEEGSRLRSAKEETVEQQLRDVEAAIYHDRKERLNDVRRRLDSVNNKIGTVDDTIRGSLNQMLLIRESSRRAADLHLEWPDFGALQAKYLDVPDPTDEHDSAPPHRLGKQAQGDGGISDAKTPILQQNLQDSPRSMTSASPARPAAQRRAHGEQPSKGMALLANSSHGLPTWSRRRDLDAAGRELVDPVTRARRALENARESFKEMGAMRLRALSQLESLAAEVVLCTDQAKERKPWARETLDEIHDLKRRVEHASASLDRPLATRLRATYFDPVANFIALALSVLWKPTWGTGRTVLAYFGIFTFADNMKSSTAAMIRIVISGVIILVALWYNGRNPQ